MSISDFLNSYPAPVATMLNRLRAHLTNTHPALCEELDLPSRILIYRIAPGMKGIVFTIIPSQKEVKLGFYRGRSLPDPVGLMQGSGKVHSVVTITDQVLKNHDFALLLESAYRQAYARNNLNRDQDDS